MFTSEQLRELASFHSDRFPLSTFYWKVPRAANRVHRDQQIQIQNLLREALRKLERENREREWIRSLEADQQRILEYFNRAAEARAADVALFSCSGDSFWQSVRLPRGLQSGFFVGETFYLQPLSVLLDQHHRYCAVLMDRTSARIFEICMGEIEERSSLLDDVPGKVKAATWTGGNERQIERRTENKAHQHYKRVAAVVLQFFKKYHFDWLILGGHADGLTAYENHLHSYLRALLIGRFPADLKAASLQEILTKSMEIVEARDCKEKQNLVQEMRNKAKHGGLAVMGLADTLQALRLGEVHTLVVAEDLQVSAFLCRSCGTLSPSETAACSLCGKPIERVEDAAEQAVEYAIQDHSQIRFVNGDESLRQAGGMGALLRFRAAESQSQSAS